MEIVRWEHGEPNKSYNVTNKIIIRIQVVRSLRSANYDIDHCLVIVKFKDRIRIGRYVRDKIILFDIDQFLVKIIKQIYVETITSELEKTIQ